MSRLEYRWMRYHPHPCLLPLTLVLLASLSSHIVSQQRWYLPPETHIVLSNLPACSTLWCRIPSQHPCTLPLLALLARLLTHTVGKRRWLRPLEEHIVLPNLILAM